MVTQNLNCSFLASYSRVKNEGEPSTAYKSEIRSCRALVGLDQRLDVDSLMQRTLEIGL